MAKGWWRWRSRCNNAEALTFGSAEAREIDLAIAPCAISWDASLWTLNPEGFVDIPGLRLHG